MCCAANRRIIAVYNPRPASRRETGIEDNRDGQEEDRTPKDVGKEGA
jgi:hypothetical protein